MVEQAQDNTPPKKGLLTRRRFLVGSGVAAAGTVAAAGGALALPGVQQRLIYNTRTDLDGNPVPPLKDPVEYGLKGIVAETLQTTAGDNFVSWHSEKLEAGKKTLVLFPGNLGHLGAHHSDEGPGGQADPYINLIKRAQSEGYQIMAVNHIGYDQSGIQPSQERLFQGAERAVDWLAEQGVAPRDMDIMGISLGTTVAAHAANHLSQSHNFQQDDSQSIRLLMVNGILDIEVGIDQTMPPGLSHYLKAVAAERLDTGKELQEMASSPGAARIRAHFLRGRDDQFTPPDQPEAHEIAAEGLKFEAKEMPGKHFIDPRYILDEFKAMKLANRKVDLTPPDRGRE